MDDLKIQMSNSDISCDMSYCMNHISVLHTNSDLVNLVIFITNRYFTNLRRIFRLENVV